MAEAQSVATPVTETRPLLRPCPLCRGLVGEVLHTQRFGEMAGSPLPSTYDVVACLACGNVFADTPAGQDDYDRFYRERSKYEEAAIVSGSGYSESDRARLEAVAAVIADAVPVDARVLDLGCAGGGMLQALHQRGMTRLTGADLSVRCVAQVEAQGFEGLEAGLFTPIPGRNFDLVILSHVLEHVRDLDRAVAALGALLAPEGRVYVEVPDASRYADYPVVPYYYFDCEHINHFGPAALDRLFLPAGFVREDGGPKELTVGPNTLYPACWALYRRSTPASPPPPDAAVRESVLAHIRASAADNRHSELLTLAETQEPVVVWGAGSYALRLLADSPLAQCRIVAFIDGDRNKHGLTLAGAPIHGPEFLAESGHRGPVLIAAALAGEAIAETIRQMGLPVRVMPL